MVRREHGKWLAPLAVYALLAAPPLRVLLESVMAAHMLVQLPLLAAVGAYAVRLLPACVRRKLDSCNAGGLPFTLLALFAAAFWMLPRSLDGALNHAHLELAKFVSLPLLVGAPLALSWRRLSAIGRGFLWSNLLSMLVVLGWLYSVAPIRVCTNYLVDQQALLGRSLLLLAVALTLLLAGRSFFGGPTPAATAPASAAQMPRLPRRCPVVAARARRVCRGVCDRSQALVQKSRASFGAVHGAIARQAVQHRRFVRNEQFGQPPMQQFEQTRQGDAVGLAGLRVQPIGELQKAREGRLAQQQRQGFREAPGVGDQIPVAREAVHALHVGEGDPVGRQDGVGRLR